MNFVSSDVCVYHLWFVFVFPWGILQLQSDWSLPCATVLIMRVNARTTTTWLVYREIHVVPDLHNEHAARNSSTRSVGRPRERWGTSRL